MGRIFGIFVVALALLSAGITRAASFDCEKASTYIETSICENRYLSALDDAYAARYKRQVWVAGDSKSDVRKEAIAALKQRNAECSDERCLANWYRGRIESMDALFYASTTPSFKVNLDHRRIIPGNEELQTHSTGEIDLSSLPVNADGVRYSTHSIPAAEPFHKSTTPLFSMPGGKRIGNLHVSVKDDGVSGSYAAVWLLAFGGNEITPPRLLYRNKDFPALLVFEQDDSWYNLSSDPRNPAWISSNTTDKGILEKYKSREELLVKASEIRVRSDHRLRSGPSTNSDILRILTAHDHGNIYPVQLRDDWLQVHYVSPDPETYGYDPDYLKKLGPEFTQQKGWIKWRAGLGNEYIFFHP